MRKRRLRGARLPSLCPPLWPISDMILPRLARSCSSSESCCPADSLGASVAFSKVCRRFSFDRFRTEPALHVSKRKGTARSLRSPSAPSQSKRRRHRHRDSNSAAEPALGGGHADWPCFCGLRRGAARSSAFSPALSS